MWQQLYNSLEIVIRRNSERLLPPDDAALDQFEWEHGHALPSSYREFIKVFGAGEVGGFFRIKAPGYPPGSTASLAEFDRVMHNDDEEDAALAKQPAESFHCKVYFSTVNGGEAVAWDLGDVRSERPREYGIFLRTRDSRFLELADSFAAFINEVCLHTGLDPAWERAGFVVEGPWPIHRVFVPEQGPKSRR